jgi:putative tryptophan/tyrosine transport system substrate-binding protein
MNSISGVFELSPGRRIMHQEIRLGFNIRLIAPLIILILTVSGIECRTASAEVVVIQSASIKPFVDAVEGFESTCGCTIGEVIITGADGSDIADKIRRLEPDAVLALGMDALASMQSIRNIPIFYTMTGGMRQPFPEMSNLSGVSIFITPERQIEAIIEVFPAAKRIGVIYDPKNTAPLVQRAHKYADTKSIEIVSRKVGSARDITPILEDMKGKIDAFLMFPDLTVITPETVDAMLLFSFRNRVPIFTFSEKYVDLGALAALIVNPYDLGAQTGEIARKIMRDPRNSSPVKTYPRKHVLLINTKIAKKLGIVIADDVLKKSVQVK